MSLLAADIGNTDVTLGLLSGEDVVAHWRLSTDDRRTADEWEALVRGVLGTRLADVEGVAVCATVPAVLHEWRAMLPRLVERLPVVVVEPGLRTGLAVHTDHPREVGTDRVMNALAALARHGSPVVVVDLGTATTFDVVDAAGRYVGGAIAPGIAVSLEALGRRGAQLRAVELRAPRAVIARNTVEALQSGVLHGAAGQVEGMVTRIAAELGLPADDLTVVATGYLAPLVLDVVDRPLRHDPWLTLHGLRLAFERNAGSSGAR